MLDLPLTTPSADEAVWVLPFALTTRTPNALTRHGELRVSDLMPGGFSGYVRLFHSVGRQEVDGARASFRQLRRVRWAALCAEVGLAFEATLSPQAVHDALMVRYGVPHQWPFEQYGPVEGTLDAEQRQALVELLAGMTPRGEAWLAYYDPSALGWTRQAELRQGDPTLIEQLTRASWNTLGVTPTLWWPATRAWCVHTDWDRWSTLVGGSRELIAKLAHHPDLDALPIAWNARLAL